MQVQAYVLKNDFVAKMKRSAWIKKTKSFIRIKDESKKWTVVGVQGVQYRVR